MTCPVCKQSLAPEQAEQDEKEANSAQVNEFASMPTQETLQNTSDEKCGNQTDEDLISMQNKMKVLEG